MGPGQQRKPLPTWSWRGWSGCAQPRLPGAAFTTPSELNAGHWGGAKGWSSSTFLLARPRATTRGGGGAKRPRLGAPHDAWWRRRLAAWPLGGRGGPRRTRYNGQFTRLLRSRCPTLAPGIQAGTFRPKKPWHTLCAMQQPVGIGQSRSHGSCFSPRVKTQQAVNAAAADSAPCWRQWAKETCQGSAGAAHGLDDGENCGLAGPELLVKQSGTWLPLWLDTSRANAKQLADQEYWGDPLPRPSLEEVDDVCKTCNNTAGLGYDCINPKAACALHRFAHGV